MAAAAQVVERRLDLARLVQRALEYSAVGRHPEALKRGAGRLAHPLGAQLLERVEVARSALAALLARQLFDVVALVSGSGGAAPVIRAAIDSAKRRTCSALVVDVVLALHLVAGESEDPSDRVLVRGVPAPGGGQRPGRVRGHELHLDPLDQRGDDAAPEPVARREHRADALAIPAVGEEADELRSGDPIRLALDPRRPSSSSRSSSAILARRLAARGASSIAAFVE